MNPKIKILSQNKFIKVFQKIFWKFEFGIEGGRITQFLES